MCREMDLKEIEAEYKARMMPYWKCMDEIIEECAKETKAYKQLE